MKDWSARGKDASCLSTHLFLCEHAPHHSYYFWFVYIWKKQFNRKIRLKLLQISQNIFGLWFNFDRIRFSTYQGKYGILPSPLGPARASMSLRNAPEKKVEKRVKNEKKKEKRVKIERDEVTKIKADERSSTGIRGWTLLRGIDTVMYLSG